MRAVEVDLGDPAQQHRGVGLPLQHLAGGRRHLALGEHAGRHLVEQRLEQVVRGLADHGHVDRRLGQRLGRPQPAEARADHHDAVPPPASRGSERTVWPVRRCRQPWFPSLHSVGAYVSRSCQRHPNWPPPDADWPTCPTRPPRPLLTTPAMYRRPAAGSCRSAPKPRTARPNWMTERHPCAKMQINAHPAPTGRVRRSCLEEAGRRWRSTSAASAESATSPGPSSACPATPFWPGTTWTATASWTPTLRCGPAAPVRRHRPAGRVVGARVRGAGADHPGAARGAADRAPGRDGGPPPTDRGRRPHPRPVPDRHRAGRGHRRRDRRSRPRSCCR